MKEKTVIRLFVASPGDVAKERKILGKIVEQINLTSNSNLNCLIEIKKWETHTFSSAGRAEEVIINQIGEYDVFLGIMWKHFGTPTGKEESGTEEEFNIALKRLEKGDIKHLGFIFSERNIPLPKRQNEIDQLSKVIAFKKRINNNRLLLYKTYSTFNKYEREVHQFIHGIISLLCEQRAHSTINIGDTDTSIEVAKRYSSLGKYDDALSILLDLVAAPSIKDDYLKIAEIEHLISLQHRHSGRFTESLEHYAAAEINIHKSPTLDPPTRIRYLRIKAGRIMVDEYFLRGQCRNAFDSYETLKQDIEDIREATKNSLSKQLTLYELHLLRQQAEMLRVSGQYEEALKMFKELYDRYGFSYSLEKAYCLVGIGDSLRLNGAFNDSIAVYEDCEGHALESRHNGLLSRVLRNKVMALISKGRDNYRLAKQELDRLSNIPGSASRFNRIYFLLASGTVFISEDPARALNYFTEAVSLSSTKQGKLRIEFLHGTFGVAESKRVGGMEGFDAKAYASLYNGYMKIGLNWGMARTLLLCEMYGVSDEMKVDRDFEGEDLFMAHEATKLPLLKNTIIYGNIP